MANKLPLYITSQEQYGPCNGSSSINQGFYWYNSQTGKDEYVYDCWVAMEKDEQGWHSEGPCNQGPNYCADSQSFCAIAGGPDYQFVGKIMPEFYWDLTYDATTGKSGVLSYDKNVIILAKLWQRIYEVLLFIYYYPFPESSDDNQRRGRRNPEIWSLIDPVQVEAHRGYDNRWTNGTLYEKRLFLPTYPKFEKAKNRYKLVNDYYKIKSMRFDGLIPINVTSSTFTYNYYITNYSRLKIPELYEQWGQPNGYWESWIETRYVFLAHRTGDNWGYMKNQTGYNNLKTYLKDFNNTCYYSITANQDGVDNSHWTNGPYGYFEGSGNEWSYAYVYNDDYYESLADDESYVKLTNPNKAELPQYAPYNFTNALQWCKDIDNHLVYIQHQNFVQFVTKSVQPNDDILFSMYKEILEKLDTKMPSNRKAEQTIILSEYIQEIQDIIKNYKINGDRCRACNSYCNAGACQATWQTCGEEACLFEKQYGGGSQAAVTTNAAAVYCVVSCYGKAESHSQFICYKSSM